MAGNGKKVLLHACCGPCSIMCIQSLRDEGYDVTGYFANPNIHPVSEYFRRREAMEQVAEQMDLPMLWQDDVYDLPGWLKMVHDLGIADNQGYARCGYCYESRLALTCAIASENGFDCFTTSLLYSRHQQHDAIRGIGTRVAASGDYRSDSGFGSEFLYRDFRVFLPSYRGSFSPSVLPLYLGGGGPPPPPHPPPPPLQSTPTPFKDFRMGQWKVR